MKLPDKDTPPGTPCWVRDNDGQKWLERKFLRAEKLGSFNWVTQHGILWIECRLDDPYAKPVPHVHHDLIVKWAADPSQRVWRLIDPERGRWSMENRPDWHPDDVFYIGEEPPKPEPRILTIEGHTFAAPSPVETETHNFELTNGPWIRRQDVDAYLAAKDALMDRGIERAIKEQLK